MSPSAFVAHVMTETATVIMLVGVALLGFALLREITR